jgi:hypothetical protein
MKPQRAVSPAPLGKLRGNEIKQCAACQALERIVVYFFLDEVHAHSTTKKTSHKTRNPSEDAGHPMT